MNETKQKSESLVIHMIGGKPYVVTNRRQVDVIVLNLDHYRSPEFGLDKKSKGGIHTCPKCLRSASSFEWDAATYQMCDLGWSSVEPNVIHMDEFNVNDITHSSCFYYCPHCMVESFGKAIYYADPY